MNVKIKRLHEAAVIPQYAHDYDAGVDLVATEDIIVEPGQTVKVSTGIAISLPAGYEAQVRPRSGITLKTKLRVALGTIDSGYNGEIGVIVDNMAQKEIYEIDLNKKDVSYCTVDYPDLIDGTYGNQVEEAWKYYDDNLRGTYLIRKGDRIAQLVIAPVEQATFIEVDTLEETQRGSGGFGSSGVKSKEDE